MAITVEQVEEAISRVLEHQSATVDGITYTLAELDKLVRLRRELAVEAAQAGGSVLERSRTGTVRRS